MRPWVSVWGDALDAVHAGFILHHAVHAVLAGGKLEHDLLEAAGRAGSLVGDLQLPAPALGEVLVHPEQVAGEDGRLVTTGAATDFHHRVLGVVRIGRDEEELDVLLHLGELGLDLRDLVAGHLPQVLVLLVHEDILRLRELVQHAFVFEAGLDNRLQLLVVLVQLHELLHVGDDGRVGERLFQLPVFVLKAQHLLQQCVLCHGNSF